MSAYVIVDIGLKDDADREAFARYARDTDRALAEAGAEVIAFDPVPTVVEGDWAPRMVVVQRYASMDAIHRFYRSDAYAPLKALRQRIADARVIAVHGTD